MADSAAQEQEDEIYDLTTPPPRLPPNFVEVPQQGATSDIYDYGIRAKRKEGHLDGGLAEVFWFCIASDSCTFMANVTKATTSARRHLKREHTGSLKTRKAGSADDPLSHRERSAAQAAEILRKHTKRSSVIAVALFVIDCFLPFSMVETPYFREMMYRVPRMNHALTAAGVRDAITEIYIATRRSLVDKLATARSKHLAKAWIHLSLDLWTCKCTHQKYAGVRIFYIDQKFELASLLLACTLWRPALLVDNSGENRNRVRPVSRALLSFIKITLKNFEIETSEIIGATTDAGSDVRLLFVEETPEWSWTWCLAHLLNRVLLSGIQDDGAARASGTLGIIASVKEAIRHFTAHPNRKDEFSRYLDDIEFTGKARGLKRHVAQRWSSFFSSCERIRDLWPTMETFVAECDIHADEVDLLTRKDEFDALIELMSPVIEVLRVAQASESGGVRYMGGCVSLWKVLAEPNAGHDPLGSRFPALAAMRTRLKRGLMSRFWIPFFTPGSHDESLDLACMLHPSFKAMPFLEPISRDPMVLAARAASLSPDEIRRNARKKLLTLARGVFKARLEQRASENPLFRMMRHQTNDTGAAGPGSRPASKRQRSAMADDSMADALCGGATTFPSAGPSVPRPQLSDMEALNYEVDEYMSTTEFTVKGRRLPAFAQLEYWRAGPPFPNVRAVA